MQGLAECTATAQLGLVRTEELARRRIDRLIIRSPGCGSNHGTCLKYRLRRDSPGYSSVESAHGECCDDGNCGDSKGSRTRKTKISSEWNCPSPPSLSVPFHANLSRQNSCETYKRHVYGRINKFVRPISRAVDWAARCSSPSLPLSPMIDTVG